LGIGSAGQDRFLAQLGSQTGGQCRFLTARERVDLGLLDLFAAASGPVAREVKLQVEGATLPARDVYPALPLLLRGQASGETVQVSSSEGSFRLLVQEVPEALGGTLSLLAAAAEIAELESRIEGEPRGEEAVRLAALSREHGLASRVMALVAVVAREGDRPGELPQTRVVPVGIPQDLRPEAYFAAGRTAAPPLGGADLAVRSMVAAPMDFREPLWKARLFDSAARLRGAMRRIRNGDARGESAEAVATEDDILFETATSLEADGGMPGRTSGERIRASLDSLERFLDAGVTRNHGPFRHHVRRLLDFLAEAELDADQEQRLTELKRRAASRSVPPTL
jgi:hypothetical protein